MEDWILTREPRYRYMLLDRMRQDCEYYIRNNFTSGNTLCEGNERDQIDVMKAIWNSFPKEDKPEWLTWEDILEFERKMCK